METAMAFIARLRAAASSTAATSPTKLARPTVSGITTTVQQPASAQKYTQKKHKHKHAVHHDKPVSVTNAIMSANLPKSPAWTSTMSITVPLYRTALGSCSGSVRTARTLMNMLRMPLPKGAIATAHSIPRRSGLRMPCIQNTLGRHNRKPTHTETLADSSQGSTEMIPAEWIDWIEPSTKSSKTSAKQSPMKVTLFIHGGAYVMCSAETHRPITWRIARATGTRILSVDYRLAPEHPWPEPLQDVVSAYLDLIDPSDPDRSRVHPSDIVVMGDSAGGGLAISLVLWLRDNGYPMPAAVVGLSPWLDLTHSQPSFRLNDLDYLPTSSHDPEWIVPGKRSHYYTLNDAFNSHPLVSPLFARDNPSRPLPPILIHVGEHERLRDESLLFASKTIRSSPIRVEIYDDQVHVFQAFASLGEPMPIISINRIGSFVQSVLDMHQTNTTESVSSPGIFRFSVENTVLDIGIHGALAMIDMGRRILEQKAQSTFMPSPNHSMVNQRYNNMVDQKSWTTYHDNGSMQHHHAWSGPFMSAHRSVLRSGHSFASVFAFHSSSIDRHAFHHSTAHLRNHIPFLRAM